MYEFCTDDLKKELDVSRERVRAWPSGAPGSGAATTLLRAAAALTPRCVGGRRGAQKKKAEEAALGLKMQPDAKKAKQDNGAAAPQARVPACARHVDGCPPGRRHRCSL